MSLWLPSAPCTPGACVETTGSTGSTVAAVPRAVLRLTLVAILVLAGVVLSPLGRGRIPPDWVRRWCRAVVRASGVRVRITGTAPPTGGLLLVANHISWLDIPLLAAVRPARMLAKTEIRRWPVAGALAARGGALFIERDRLRALPETVAHIAGELRAGAAVAAFPEGSTWCGRAQGAFHRAVFQAALDAGVPVQPVRIRYLGHAGGAASTAPAFVGDDSLLASLWRVATARDLVAEVDVRPVLPPGACPDRRALARAARQDLPDDRDHGTDPRSTATCGHAAAGHVPVGHALVGRVSGRDAVAGHVPVGHVPVGHVPVGHVPVGHAPAGRTSAGDAVAGHGLAGDTLAGRASAGDAVAGHGLAGDTLAGRTSAGDALAGQVSAGGAPVGHIPAGGDALAGRGFAGRGSAGHAPAGAAIRPPRPRVQDQTRRTVCRDSA